MLGRQFQPLCLSSDVRGQPYAATVAGEAFAAFRGVDGHVAVFVDRCPHRGMQLSKGKVRDGVLTCAYHGWSFGVDGCGSSPGNPGLQTRAAAVEAIESAGVVWVRRHADGAVLPDLSLSGFRMIHRAFVEIDAPMEVVLDNFTEIEHTGIGHWQFGYEQARLSEIEFKVSQVPDGVDARSIGPQKRMAPFADIAMGVRHGDRLIVDIRARYAPLHVSYEWWWEDRTTGTTKGPRFREIAFFSRLDDRRSRLVAFYYWATQDRPWLFSNRLAQALAARAIAYEIGLDAALCAGIVQGAETLVGCHLGRFDALLPLHRRRIREEIQKGHAVV
jgi:phenylpropionate dioxygenase-like ring-hydroxylating dioxygenase large terminal subunit